MKEKFNEKYKFFVRTHRKIGILIDSIKGFLITLLILTLIVFFGSAIIHNILRAIEASNNYSGKYKKLYKTGNEMMNLYSEGEGSQTLIILPELGSSSPVLKYKALADSLSSTYKVVISEPLGYGYSLSTKKERTSKNIINELRGALKTAEINGPYVLLAFSNSSIYADYYSKEFPEEVLGIISINGFYPESMENETFKDKYLPNVVSNVNFYSGISFSGFFRWKSYLSPDSFDIDKMQANNSYGKEEIKLYRERLSNRFLTKEMRNECKKLKDNMNELKDFKYSENLTTLQILTTNYRDEYLERGENILKYTTNLVSNKDIQKSRTINGDIGDYLYTDDGIKSLKNLIVMYF